MRVAKAPAERRAELLAAARQLFDEKGVDKTRVSDIVRRVGVAQGVFYYYFASKEEVVERVLCQVEAELAEGIEALLAQNTPFAAKAAQFITLYVGFLDGFLADDADDTRALNSGFFAENQLLRGGRRVLLRGWQQLVAQGCERGELTLRCPEATAKALVYGLEGIAFEHIPARATINAVAEQALGLAPGSLT